MPKYIKLIVITLFSIICISSICYADSKTDKEFKSILAEYGLQVIQVCYRAGHEEIISRFDTVKLVHKYSTSLFESNPTLLLQDSIQTWILLNDKLCKQAYSYGEVGNIRGKNMLTSSLQKIIDDNK